MMLEGLVAEIELWRCCMPEEGLGTAQAGAPRDFMLLQQQQMHAAAAGAAAAAAARLQHDAPSAAGRVSAAKPIENSRI